MSSPAPAQNPTAAPLNDAPKAPSALDVATIRNDFPILKQTVHGHPLVYFDNASSKQKPRAVIDAMTNFQETSYANVHRGTHFLSTAATEAVEAVRQQVASFINAPSANKDANEIVFTSGTTEAINLVAHSYGQAFLQSGDEILMTEMEHHANYVPWQQLRDHHGITLKSIPVTKSGELDYVAFENLLSAKTKIVAVTHVSNSLGTINDIKRITQTIKESAHTHDAVVMVDGCQAGAHIPIDVQDLGCDFYVFSAHKMYGPTGVGALYAKSEHLAAMPPYQTGGEMIEHVSFETSTFAAPPHKFEAGTPPIVEIIGFGAAIEYLQSLDQAGKASHEQALLTQATERLNAIKGLKIYGTAPEKISILTFTVEGTHPSDLATLLDTKGFALRSGHHCNMPLMQALGVEGTARASLCFYNTPEEVDRFATALQQCVEMCR